MNQIVSALEDVETTVLNYVRCRRDLSPENMFFLLVGMLEAGDILKKKVLTDE